jgi:RHS repeat-associated protein
MSGVRKLLLLAAAMLALFCGHNAAADGVPGQQALAAPLVAWGAAAPGERRALALAISKYSAALDPIETASLAQFLAAYPNSDYRVSLWLDIGLAHEHAADYAAAIVAFERGLAAAGPPGRLGYTPDEAVADQILAELLKLQTGFANQSELASLLADPRVSADGGVLTAPALVARRSLWALRHTPDQMNLCGAVALQEMLAAAHRKAVPFATMPQLRSAQGGLTLAALARVADAAGMPVRAIRVSADAPIPVPSVMHWRMGHYVAIIAVRNGRYLVDDPALEQEVSVSRDVLEYNASGYYLVPANVAVAAGWRVASANELASIRGGGVTVAPDPSRTDSDTPICLPCLVNALFSGADPGMPTYAISTLLASIRISDNPVGYHPPVGPDAEFQITYNQQDDSLPATPDFGNLGPQWSDNFISFVQDDPNDPGSSVTLALAGGGYRSYLGYNRQTGAFTPEEAKGAILTRVSATEYKRVFADGTEDIYAEPDGSTSNPRRIFLTRKVDRYGNAMTLTYDTSLRLMSITDAIGQATTLHYTNATYPLLLTRVTDPYGRTATIGYDASGRLDSLTDAMGMQSSFTYNAAFTLPSTFIASMTTPYGTTSFAGSFGTTYNPYPYWVTATDPLGNTERDEAEQEWDYPAFSESNPPAMPGTTLFNEYLNSRDAWYWDKAAYAKITDKSKLATPGYNVADYEKAVVTHFQHQVANDEAEDTSGVAESVLNPLERNLANPAYTSRIWYAHPGDGAGVFSPSTGYTGSLDLPSQIARILPDGTTQLTQIRYNAEANITSLIDPMGRETDTTYAANGIDVTAITQKSQLAGGGANITAFTYNKTHEPLTATDAAGQTTTFTYNGKGQVLSVTNALNQTTNFNYNGKAQLATVLDADGKLAESFTYDNVGRIATATDSQGYTLRYAYDNLDRVVTITYPDNSTRHYTYTRLDITSITDRLGRITRLAYDANRNVTAVTDPLGRTVHYGYDPDGRLISLTDAQGQKTAWTRDLEGRVTSKISADGTRMTYAYDSAGRMISRTDALGQVTNYTYTKDDKIAAVHYANTKNPTASVSFTWDSVYPRIDAMTDGTGKTSFAYVPVGTDGALQLASETGPSGSVSQYAYAYDALGRINKLTVAGVTQDATTYDALGRDVTDTTPLGAFNTAYLGETGQVSSVTALAQKIAGVSAVTSYSYLANSGDRRLSGISFTADASSNETLATDAAARITARTDGTGKIESYSYDAADRLIAGSVSAPTASSENYTYNAADFISAKSGETTAANNWTATNTGLVNDIGSLTPSGGLGRTYTYDANGNVLSDGLRTYTWDAENRLLSITEISTGHVSSFTYDALGRRVAITENSGVTLTSTGYLWCGATICAAYQSGAVTARYQPQGEIQYSGGTGADYYYERDHLGSVLSLTNSTGTVEGTLATDAYGNTLSQTGTAPTFGYAGMFLHQPTTTITPIYLTLNRAYDPYSGRWLSRDPAGEGGGINLYGYVQQDPITGYDLFGLSACPLSGSALAADAQANATNYSSTGGCVGAVRKDLARSNERPGIVA